MGLTKGYNTELRDAADNVTKCLKGLDYCANRETKKEQIETYDHVLNEYLRQIDRAGVNDNPQTIEMLFRHGVMIDAFIGNDY